MDCWFEIRALIAQFARRHRAMGLGFRGNAVKLSEIYDDPLRGKVSQVAQDSEVSQVPRMR